MTPLGEVALWVALVLAIWGAGAAFVGGRTRRGDLILSAERSVVAVFGLLALASLAVISAFIRNEYQYQYVYGYSNRDLPLYYKISGLWAGQTGSLLFWALLLGFFATLTVVQNRTRNRELMPYVAATLLTVLGFLLVVIVTVSNPFSLLPFAPADGQGLNPQLQNYWMTIHPPTLYLGFTAFTIPFSFAIAALITGKLDATWITTTRRWTLLSWFFLTNGIIFGMMWAYVELGWGGYWFWDPVENASLLPWLTATAFLHSVMIQEKRGMLKMWNMLLVLGTFLLSIFATFLTRSGLIESVHTFAQNLQIANIFLGFMTVATLTCAGLVYWRRNELVPENELQSFVSREAAFIGNNLLFVAAMFAVLWGSTLPLVSEWFGQKIAVGPVFFNRVTIPIGLILLALMGVGPIIAWRKASPRNLQRNFTWPVLVGLAVGAAFWATGVRHLMVILTFALGAFTLTTVFVEFGKGTRARASIEGEGLAKAFIHLIQRNRRRYGGYVVHIGFVVMFMGFAGGAYDANRTVALLPGETAEITSPFGHTYQLTYQAMSWFEDQNSRKLVATVQVAREGRSKGILAPEQRSFRQRPEINREVRILRSWNEDLYVILAGIDDADGVILGTNPRPMVTFEFLVNPMVPWIWTGGIIMALGTLVAMWPTVPAGSGIASTPVQRPARVRRERELAGV